MTTLVLDEIIDILGDGNWHTMQEIERKIEAKWDKIFASVAFLSNWDLIETQRTEEGVVQQIKLSQPMIEWYVKVTRG